MNNYTPEQIKDIQERVVKANEILKELQLSPAGFVTSYKVEVTDGSDVFATKVQTYLQDTRYDSRISSNQSEELKNN